MTRQYLQQVFNPLYMSCLCGPPRSIAGSAQQLLADDQLRVSPLRTAAQLFDGTLNLEIGTFNTRH